jgi:hypothetical protein
MSEETRTVDLMRLGGRMVNGLRSKHLMEAKKRVARGVKWLDRRDPGWWKKINPNRFDIKDPHKCILGQMFAEEGKKSDLAADGFHWAMEYIPALHAEGAMTERGFMTYGEYHSDDPNYDELQWEWWEVITARQKGMRKRKTNAAKKAKKARR